VRIPSLTRRAGSESQASSPTVDSSTPTTDNPPTTTDRPATGSTRAPVQEDDRTTYRSQAAVDTKADRRSAVARRLEARRAADATIADRPAAMPRPRASGLATLGLMLSVISALGVLTGALAAPAVALGVVAMLFGIGGISATSRRHVAGRIDALLAVIISLGAIVVGVLAMSGAVPWLHTDTNQVTHLRSWLDTQLPWLKNL
jgi:hypothetical protein